MSVSRLPIFLISYTKLRSATLALIVLYVQSAFSQHTLHNTPAFLSTLSSSFRQKSFFFLVQLVVPDRRKHSQCESSHTGTETFGVGPWALTGMSCRFVFICSVWHLCFAWFCLCCSLSSVTVDVFHLYWDRYSYRYFIFVLFIVKRKHKQVNRYNVSLATVTAYRFHIKVWYDTINNADVNDQTTCSRLFGLAPSLSCYGKISQVSSLTASYQNLYVFTKTCYLVILTHWSDFNQTPHL